VKDLFIEPNTVAWLSIGLIGIVAALFVFIVAQNSGYKNLNQEDKK
jgi:hypothetical protein